jgi:hypothetical protein
MAVLGEVVARVREVPGVTGTLSLLDGGDTMFVGAGGRGMFVVVGLDADSQPERLVEPLRAATGRLAARLRADHPRLTLRWTGEVPVNVDVREASARESRRGEQRVLPLPLVLLLPSARSRPRCCRWPPAPFPSSSRSASPSRSTPSSRCRFVFPAAARCRRSTSRVISSRTAPVCELREHSRTRLAAIKSSFVPVTGTVCAVGSRMATGSHSTPSEWKVPISS